ncbi:MAG TPA: HAD hydrolase-like protein [Verrucomicrobiae bacterium]|nr:HAD hydrolase-like protein [Verrucomicrobiae bacterium]
MPSRSPGSRGTSTSSSTRAWPASRSPTRASSPSALEAAGVAPAEAVYVGDSYFVDVIGARRAGLGTVLFDPGGVWGPRDCVVAAGLRAAVEQAAVEHPVA